MAGSEISVCYIKNYLGSGGSSDLFLEISKRADERYRFAAYGTEGGNPSTVKQYEKEGIAVEVSDTGSKLDPRTLYQMYKYIQKNEFDVIHAHLPYSQFLSRIFSIAASETSIVSKQSSMPENYHPVIRFLERVTQPIDYKTITATRAVQESFTGSSNLYSEDPESKWCTIYNGINVQEFSEKVDNAEISDIVDRYSLQSGPVLLNIGRYTPAKSQADLIPVMQKVTNKQPDATLLIVGYGELESELKSKVQNADLSENIYITGRAKRVYPLYKVADLFVLSSRTEGFGIVNLEAMCSQLPIVATDIPAIREIVDDGRTGELVEPGDHSKMSKSILDILSNEDKMKEYSRTGFKRVKKNFSISDISEQYLKVYEEASY